MTKKRPPRKRKPKGRPTTGKAASSSARMVGERIAAAGPDYIRDNFIRIVRGCGILRREPEFADFYLDSKQTLEAAARHFPRFTRRLRRVAPQEDEEAAAPIYDEYRIAVLDDLDSPQLRQQLQSRLEQCIDRLKRGHDAEKIELALFLSTLLSDEMGEILKGKEAVPRGDVGRDCVAPENGRDGRGVEIGGTRVPGGRRRAAALVGASRPGRDPAPARRGDTLAKPGSDGDVPAEFPGGRERHRHPRPALAAAFRAPGKEIPPARTRLRQRRRLAANCRGRRRATFSERRAAATCLLDVGEEELAGTLRQQARKPAQSGQMDVGAARKLRYEMRRLTRKLSD
jgi:hypothetical protein